MIIQPAIKDAVMPYGNANYNGWCCPYCGGRNYPQKPNLDKCQLCGQPYYVPYVRF